MNSLYYPVFLRMLNIYSMIDLGKESALPYLIEQQKVKYGDKYIQVDKLANILDKLANPVLTILHK